MEWLQAYKIGNAMLKKGSKIEDAYYQSYRLGKNKEGIDKTPCIIDIIIDTKKETISVQRLAFHMNKSIEESNFFTSISGNFTSFYLCNSYLKCDSILDFFGLNEKGEIVADEDTKGKATGFKKAIIEVSKSRKKDYLQSSFMPIRTKLRGSENLCKKLGTVINGLGFIVEQSKKIEKWDKLDNFFDKEKQQFKEFTKLNFFPKDTAKGTDEVVFVTLSIDSEKLNRNEDYKAFCIDRFLDIGQLDCTKELNAGSYFGNENKVFDVSFPRDSINLLKSSTGSPTTLPNLIGTGFLLSENAYNALKLGAKKIDSELKIRIAGVQHYVIPEFTGELDTKRFSSDLKDNFELSFATERLKNTGKRISLSANKSINAFVLLGHIKGKGDIDFVNSMRISSTLYFDELMDKLHEASRFSDDVSRFSLSQISYLFPIPSDKSKRPDSLFFYKSIFEKTPYDTNLLMDNYGDLIRLFKYGRPYDKAGKKYYGGTINIRYSETPDFDVKISGITRKFQVLINLLNHLFMENNTSTMDYSTLPSKTQNLFRQCNYQEDKAALFYLGKLVRLAAEAQAKKQRNKRRPILDKINYSGMKPLDIKWLFIETFDKLRQYEFVRYAHEDLAEFKRYFDIAESKWKLSDIENVFYLFSGYAMYWEVQEKIPNSLKKYSQENNDKKDYDNNDDSASDENEETEE